MEVYNTEEEQVEALKKWWKDNGSTILISLVVFLVVAFGWRVWQDHNRTIGEAASTAFQNLLDASQKLTTHQETLSKESIEIKSIETLGQIVLDEHAGTQYATHAHLLLVKKAVLIEDYDTAARLLKDILQAKPDESLALLTRYRLAKVLLAKKDYEEALATLEVAAPGAFAAAYAELKGDIALHNGEKLKARGHYEAALDLAAKDSLSDGVNGAGSTRPMLEVKYHDLAGVAE